MLVLEVENHFGGGVIFLTDQRPGNYPTPQTDREPAYWQVISASGARIKGWYKQTNIQLTSVELPEKPQLETSLDIEKEKWGPDDENKTMMISYLTWIDILIHQAISSIVCTMK